MKYINTLLQLLGFARTAFITLGTTSRFYFSYQVLLTISDCLQLCEQNSKTESGYSKKGVTFGTKCLPLVWVMVVMRDLGLHTV